MSPKKPVFGGRYEIGAPLGEGGMATVYAGTDTVLGRPVAVKVLAPRYATDASFVARFRREAQSAAAMNHPNIVNVYDTGSDDDTHYIVMELVEGRTLRDVLASEGPLLPERSAEIAEAVADGLAYAHDRGIVHRDIKPGNIMITPSGDVKVMDFGIARATSGESLTQTATVLGTATYLSPEQAQGEAVDARSDLYSLGVVLYELLTGQPPFEGDSPVAVAYKHVREEPVRPSVLNPDVPDALERIVLKAMAKNPGNRYPSSAELRDDLGRFLQGQPVAATPLLPPDATEVVHRPARSTTAMPVIHDDEPPGRSGARTAGIVALVVLILAALGTGLFFLANSLLGEDAERVVVPRCVNNTLDACQQLLTERGLRSDITREFDPDANQDIVLSQDPPPGEEVDEGTVIQLVVSRGAEQVEVPDVLNRPIEEARQILDEAGFRVLVESAFNPDVEEGVVFAQDPDPGTKANPDRDPVQLTVSLGADTVAVPDVRGMTLQEASDTLQAAGLVLGTVTEADLCVPPVNPGEVCDQDPGPGNEVEPGSAVNVTVQGQEPSPSPSPTATVSPSPT